MSSNGFPRARSRVRHQRVSKSQTYAHPRFLQLVKELARLEEAKRKQDNTGHSGASPNNDNAQKLNHGCGATTACAIVENAPATTSSSQQHSTSHHRPHQHNHHQHTQHQQRAVIDCWPVNANVSGTNCCTSLDEALMSVRPINFNRSSSALNDSYYRQNSSNDNSQMADLQLQQNYHQQRHHSYPSNNHQNSIDSLPSNISQGHDSQQDCCCPNKCSSSSSAAPASNINFGYSKTSLIVQNSTDRDSDPRQDENRSKRKRSAHDSSGAVKKVPPSLSPSSCSKRQKSSPEPVRPLSPSFTKCPICLLDCMDRDPSFTNTCFHLFCFVCIENWSKSKATCPLCRTKFTKIVYNIRSAVCFDEKVASPIRRDDDDERIIYEQINGLNASLLGSTRTPNSEGARLLFDRSEGLVMPHHLTLFDHFTNRQLNAAQSFNTVTSNSNFNSSVPHTPFTAASYNSVLPNYITMLHSNDRSQAAAIGPAISSAYPTNTSSTIINSDSSNRLPRIPRSGRFIYTHNSDLTPLDGATRISRSTSTDLNQSGISLEPRQHHHHNHHHHHQLHHGTHHQHHGQHNQQSQQQQHHRATVANIDLGPTRQSQRVSHPHSIPYLHIPRQYPNPSVYSRRPYTNPPAEPRILDNLHRQMPDM